MSRLCPQFRSLLRWLPLVVALALSACESDTQIISARLDTKGAEPSQPAGSDNDSIWQSKTIEPVSGGQAVFGELGDVDSLNPYTKETIFASHVTDLIMPRLFDEQPDYQKGPPSFKPRFVESWKRSDDGMSITFKLREDVFWSDGTPMTSEDLRFTWQAALSTEVAWVNRSIADQITDVEIVDERTAIYHYAADYPYQLMDANDMNIIPKHVFGKVPFSKWRQYDWNRPEALVTSGPFKLVKYQAQVELVLERNEKYFDPERPRLDRVVFRVVPDADALFTGVLAGTFEFYRAIEPKNIEMVRESPTLDLAAYKGRRYTLVNWNTAQPKAVTNFIKELKQQGKRPSAEELRAYRDEHPHRLFGDPKVRLAMTLAIDRQRIIDGVFQSYARPCASPILSVFWAHNTDIEPHPHDTERARQLLSEAGWSDSDGDGALDRDGVKFEFELITNSGNKIREAIQTLMVEDLAKLGIIVKPRKLEWTVLVETTRSKNYDAYVGGWSSGTKVDMKPVYHTLSMLSGFNRNSYSNARLDELIDEARVMTDYRDAKPLWYEGQEILHREQPMTYIAELYDTDAINKRFHNVTLNSLSPYQSLEDWVVPLDQRKR